MKLTEKDSATTGFCFKIMEKSIGIIGQLLTMPKTPFRIPIDNETISIKNLTAKYGEGFRIYTASSAGTAAGISDKPAGLNAGFTLIQIWIGGDRYAMILIAQATPTKIYIINKSGSWGKWYSFDLTEVT